MKKKEEAFPLTMEQKNSATAQIRDYIMENFDLNIGNLQAEFFLEFISEKIAPFYYNKAIADSLAFITDKTEDMYLLMKGEEL